MTTTVHRLRHAIAAALVLASCAAFAAPPQKLGPEFLVNNSIQAGDQKNPSVAALVDGGFVVAWEDGLFARRYSAAGLSPEGQFEIVDPLSRPRQRYGDLSVAGLANGGFIFVWHSVGGVPGGGYGIGYRRYVASGIGSDRVVLKPPGRNHYDPVIAGLTNGGFAFAWNYVGPQNFDIAYQVYNSAERFLKFGTANTYLFAEQRDPAIVALPGGRFVVTWGGPPGIRGQIFSAAGNPLGGEFQVGTGGESAVSALTDGSFIVVWSRGPDASNREVFGQRFSTLGARIGAEFQVNTTTLHNQFEPSVAGLSGGGFVVTWTSQGQDGSGYGIYGRIYNASGQRVGGEFRVNSHTFSTQWDASIAALPNNQFVVVWSSYGQDGDKLGIYGQRYAP